MASMSEEWIEKAISDGHINYLEYSKFTDPVVIGIGGFGKVFKYEWRNSELTVALKCLKVDMDTDEKSIKDFINELKLIRKVCYHPNIIMFYGITKDIDGCYNLVLQYADNGTLRKFLQANFTNLQWIDKLRIAKEVALGLLFLHDNSIIHRDLHSKNILIHQGQPKIADFGLSKQINEMSRTSNSIVHGMVAYIEPKCFINIKYKRDNRSDVYSFGVILWEISSGRPPFKSFEPGMPLVIHISQGNREKPIKDTPSQYIELYKKCWDNEPVNRPETKLILNTLKQLIPNETLSRNHPIENRETFKNHQDNTPINSSEITTSTPLYLSDALVNTSEITTSAPLYLPDVLVSSSEITTSAPLCLPDTIISNTLAQDNNILENMRKKAFECFEHGKFFKALELYEEILKNSQHSTEDQISASTWDLFYHKCGLENLDELIKALYRNTTLTSLNLGCNKLESEGGKTLADALCNNTTLTSLDLYQNYLGPFGGKALSDALCKNVTLTSLNLYWNNLGPEGGKALAYALYKNTTLTSLDLGKNEIGSEGGKALADALCKNTTLTSLNLQDNNLGLEGGKALADALCKNATLISLNLHYNEFGSEIGKELADALCTNITLKDLNLGRNELGSKGGKALAEALCKNTTLTSLNLESNKLGSEEGKALANALCKNTTLTSLNLENNKLGSEGRKALEDALCKNTTLNSLNLQDKNINFNVKSKLSQWMQKAIDGHHVEFIPYGSFTDHKEIARSTYGEVIKAYWPIAEKAVALKSVFDNPDSESDKDCDPFIKEFKLIRSVRYHDNVIRVFGISHDPTTSRYFMVLQYADGGSLRDYLQKNFQKLDWRKKISMGKQIASGLKCIHDQFIVHRDLHSKNILVNQDNLIITDFGLSKTSGSSEVSAFTNMFAYLEPQCFIDSKFRCDKASDIYSLGVLLWEISSGRPPFHNQDIFEISNKVKNGEREKPVDGMPNDYRILYEWAWSQNPKDRPDINMIRAGLDKMLVDGRQNDNSVGSLTNSMKNTLNLTAPNLPNLPNSPSFNQQNNNKRNNMPQPYQPGTFNPNLNLNGNLIRSKYPNNLQNYTPQIYQPIMSYANNNNNHVIGRPLYLYPPHNVNMNQGMTPIKQQLPNNVSNVNYPPGMNNFQQPIYPTVNADQSQPYHNTNQNLMPSNFNNQQQFKPIAYEPPNMDVQSMANMPTINAPIQAYQQFPEGNVNQPVLGANLNQPVPGNNQQVLGNIYNQQALGGNFDQASINYQIDNRQYQQGVQQSGLPNTIPVGHQPTGCKQILEKYEKYFKLKPTECKAGYHAGFGDIEGLKYHLSSCGESITSTYEFGKTNDLLCVIIARYCDNIAMVEDIFKLLKLLRYPSGQLNDPSKQPNLSWNSVKYKKTVLHYLSQNNNLISDIDINIFSKDKKKHDVSEIKEHKKKMETFHNHITSVIKFLVEDGCDINAKDDNERTVLGLYLNKTTFQVGFTKVIEVLLKNGANPNINIIVRTKNLNRKSSSEINVSHMTSNGSASNLRMAEGCITLPNMLFLAIWNRWPTRVLDLLKEHGVDINTKYDNLDGLGNLLMMCLEKSKNGIGSQFPYTGLEWVLNNVPNICEKENLEAAKKLTDKNSEERKLIKHKIGKKKGWFGLN